MTWHNRTAGARHPAPRPGARLAGAAPSAYRVSQGARVGRAGTVEITADLDGTVWVGRATTACIHGTITL